MGADVLWSYTGAAVTGNGDSGPIDTTRVSMVAFDLNVTALTGGTSPTVTFFVERQGADSNWYQVLSTSGITGALTVSVDISPGLTGTYSAPPGSAQQHAVLSKAARVRWLFGGTVAPTSVAFTASFVGRS